MILAKGFGSWEPEKVGSFTGLVLNVEDMAATCAALRDAGVRFDLEPEQQAWGMQAVIADRTATRSSCARSRELSSSEARALTGRARAPPWAVRA